jgi:hypothetical protein
MNYELLRRIENFYGDINTKAPAKPGLWCATCLQPVPVVQADVAAELNDAAVRNLNLIPRTKQQAVLRW